MIKTNNKKIKNKPIAVISRTRKIQEKWPKHRYRVIKDIVDANKKANDLVTGIDIGTVDIDRRTDDLSTETKKVTNIDNERK